MTFKITASPVHQLSTGEFYPVYHLGFLTGRLTLLAVGAAPLGTECLSSIIAWYWRLSHWMSRWMVCFWNCFVEYRLIGVNLNLASVTGSLFWKWKMTNLLPLHCILGHWGFLLCRTFTHGRLGCSRFPLTLRLSTWLISLSSYLLCH